MPTQPSTVNIDQISQLPIQLQLSEKQHRLMSDPLKAGSDCLMLHPFFGVNKTASKLTDYRQLLRVQVKNCLMSQKYRKCVVANVVVDQRWADCC